MNQLSTIGCGHFGPCSGCTLNEKVDEPPIWSEVKEYFNDLQIGAITGWRIKAKLAVRGTAKAPIIGLFRSGTHDALAIPFCKIHHPAINRAVRIISQAISEQGVVPYDDNTRHGSLRYIQCLVDLKTDKVQLVLVWNHPGQNRLMEKFAHALSMDPIFHSIWFNFQPANTNRIFGDQWIQYSGEPYLWQKLSDLLIPFHPAAFSQAHWSLFERLAHTVVSWIPSKCRLVEYYSGIGVLGLLAAPKCESVELIESNPYAYKAFQQIKSPPKVSFHSLDAKNGSSFLNSADCVLLDPPRKGIDPELLKSLVEWSGTLIYVSCDFKSFKRDLQILQKSGWSVVSGKGYLLFPGTNHVEIVALLKKAHSLRK